MSAPHYNAVEWFEVATDRPEEAQRFYGELFGWTFTDDGGYRQATAPGTDHPSGGIMDSGGKFAGYAIFYVTVEGVAATVAKAESLGAKVVVPPTTNPAGLTFAHLRDSTGNHFGVFSPPPSA